MFSLLDGFAKVHEYAERQKEINQKYLCITDHGVMGAIPQQISESEKHDLTPIFGCEMYVNSMQTKVNSRAENAEIRKGLETDEEKKKFSTNSHLLGIAYSDEGYANLVKLTSWGWIHGFYKKPRVNHEILKQYKEGIIFTSTCASSEIARAFFDGGDDSGFKMIETYLDMFGENFYLELMMLDYKPQKPYDAFLIRAHDKYGTPLIISQDCHYCKKEHSKNQRYMLMMQTGKTIPQMQEMVDAGMAEDMFELQDENLWLKSEDELNQKWESDFSQIIDYELYKQAKANTVKICEKASSVTIDRSIKLPMVNDADDKLIANVKRGYVRRGCPRGKESGADRYASRIKEEYELITEKGFASYFLIQQQMTDEARRAAPGILGFGVGAEAVGPGRGSACGSLVAYCLGLHDVDPIKHDLLFSRFLSPARGGKQMKMRFSIDPIAHEKVLL